MLKHVIQLQEETKWLKQMVEKMDHKLDRLLQSHIAFKWKIIGASMTFSVLSALLIEFYRGKS